MTSTSSALVNACGPVNGIFWPTSSSVSSAFAATAAMSVSTMGAVDAVAYGPLTTSPALICGAHMPTKLVMNTVGRRLTHSTPESTASCSTSLLRSPRNRDGWREKSSSALIADSATRRVTPSRRARCHHRVEFVAQCAGIEKHRRRAGQALCRGAHDLDAGGKLGGVGVPGDGADLDAGVLTSCVTSGRPTLPVAPVTRIAFMQQGRAGARKSYTPARVTFRAADSSLLHERFTVGRSGVAQPPPVPGEPRLPDARRRRRGRGRRAGGVPAAGANRPVADRRCPRLADRGCRAAVPGPDCDRRAPGTNVPTIGSPRRQPIERARSGRPGHPRRRSAHRAAGGAAPAESRRAGGVRASRRVPDAVRGDRRDGGQARRHVSSTRPAGPGEVHRRLASAVRRDRRRASTRHREVHHRLRQR